jgi:hypothetical protein
VELALACRIDTSLKKSNLLLMSYLLVNMLMSVQSTTKLAMMSKKLMRKTWKTKMKKSRGSKGLKWQL